MIKTKILGGMLAFAFVSMIGLAMTNAHPKFAVRQGFTCVQCHVDNQGGAMRNDYGTLAYSKQMLPLKAGTQFIDPAFTGIINDHIRIGSDIRMQYYNYVEQAESVGNAFFPMQADFYVAVQPASQFTLFYEQSLFDNLVATDIWAKYDLQDNKGYARIGQFVPAYGMRHDDHTSFFRGGNVGGTTVSESVANIPQFRQGLHWIPSNNTVGIELSYNVLNTMITGSVGKSRGGDLYQYTLSALRPVQLGSVTSLIGASYFSGSFVSSLDRYSYYGIFGGLDIGKFTFLGEADLTQDYPVEGATGYATYAELNYELIQGLHAVLEYDLFDADRDAPNTQLVRYTAGAEFFPFAYFELKPQIRWLYARNTPEFYRREILVQTHFWF